MNLLARREHSQDELFRKLSLKKFAQDEIKTALAKLCAEGLLSNTRFAENYIHARSIRGYGPLRIRAELLEKGLTEEVIEHHLNIADNAWLVQIRSVWQKRFKGRVPSDFKTQSQQMRFLQYRGFTQDQIKSIFKSDEDYEQ